MLLSSCPKTKNQTPRPSSQSDVPIAMANLPLWDRRGCRFKLGLPPQGHFTNHVAHANEIRIFLFFLRICGLRHSEMSVTMPRDLMVTGTTLGDSL